MAEYQTDPIDIYAPQANDLPASMEVPYWHPPVQWWPEIAVKRWLTDTEVKEALHRHDARPTISDRIMALVTRGRLRR